VILRREMAEKQVGLIEPSLPTLVNGVCAFLPDEEVIVPTSINNSRDWAPHILLCEY
jgi:hypothetical protein